MGWRSIRTKLLVDELARAQSEDEAPYILFDTETTGLSAENDRIIEIGAIKVFPNGKEETFCIYIRPETPVSEKITELTGITNDFLSDKPSESEAFSKIFDFFGENPIVAAYNIRFDVRFMQSLYSRAGKSFSPELMLDVLEMARDIVPKNETKNYKLATIAEVFKIGENASYHNAVDDCVVTHKLLQTFIGLYGEKTSEPVDKRIALVNSASYWEGPKGIRRIYVNTDIGTVYYDLRTHSWESKDLNMNEVDMEDLEAKAWEITQSKDEESFGCFRSKVYADRTPDIMY